MSQQWQPPQHNPRRQPAAPYPYGYYPPQYAPPRRRPNVLPPYPSHLVRFPVRLLPRARRRGRGHSVFFYVYIGTHPVALLFALILTMMAWGVLMEWVALVAFCWLAWAGMVSAWWLCTVPFAAAVPAMRRR